MVLDVRLGQRRAHAVPEGDQRQVGVLGAGDLGELLDIGGHVVPGGYPGLSEFVGSGGLAVSAQVEGVNDAALGGQETGQPVVSPAVFGDAVSDLYDHPRTDSAGRQPLSNKYRGLVDL